MLGKDYPGQDCALARALEVVGERWTLLVLRDVFFGVQRFSDFVAHLDVPRAVLADRLRSLVVAGVLERRADPATPGREIYALTDDGAALWPALHALTAWGRRFGDDPEHARRYRHADCGPPPAPDLAADGHCPRCGTVPAARDVLTVPPTRPSRRTDRVSRALDEPRPLVEPLSIGR